jgi:hypothetical protein
MFGKLIAYVPDMKASHNLKQIQPWHCKGQPQEQYEPYVSWPAEDYTTLLEALQCCQLPSIREPIHFLLGFMLFLKLKFPSNFKIVKPVLN